MWVHGCRNHVGSPLSFLLRELSPLTILSKLQMLQFCKTEERSDPRNEDTRKLVPESKKNFPKELPQSPKADTFRACFSNPLDFNYLPIALCGCMLSSFNLTHSSIAYFRCLEMKFLVI